MPFVDFEPSVDFVNFEPACPHYVPHACILSQIQSGQIAKYWKLTDDSVYCESILIIVRMFSMYFDSFRYLGLIACVNSLN